jgi:hypothetical protein
MIQGLKSTLLTVAVALLGLNAMAMAPTIGNIPDVIIGDAEAGTNSNNFVYPDAINLDSFVADDNTPTTGILWSYTNPSGHYRINNVAAIVSPDSNADTPGSAELTTADDPDSSDSNKRTITIRNSTLSPLTGGVSTAPYADPGATSDSAVITLYASDSTTHALAGKSFMAYIVNNGNDALSGGAASVPVTDIDFGAGTNGWVPVTVIEGGTTRQNASLGLCATAPAGGVNYFGWESEAYPANAQYTSFSYVNNAVWRVRLQVTTTAAASHVPVWGLVFENGVNYYGGTQLFFDNVGATSGGPGANTPPSAGGRSEFETWLVAPSGSSAAFQAGITANAALKNFRIRLLLIDIGTAGGDDPYGAGSDVGEVCWKRIQVDRYDAGDMTVESTPYSASSLSLAAAGTDGVAGTVNGALRFDDYSNSSSNITFSGNAMTIAPKSATAWVDNSAYIRVETGDDQFDYNVENNDNYPVVWEADQLYRVVFAIKAADATGETYPPDFINIGADVPSNEITFVGYVTNKFATAAMPKAAATTEYVTFLHGNSVTFGSASVFARIRPYLTVGTNSAFAETDNRGGITITSIRVEKVKF